MLAGADGMRSDRGMRERRGWFKVPGVQDGDRTLEEQITGLDEIAATCAKRSVLDIGCAEGLIAKWLHERGARHIDCIGMVEGQLEVGRKLCTGRPIRFHRADVRKAEQLAPLKLRRTYDAVLLLSIVHKMQRPDELLAWAAKRARMLVAIRLPGAVYKDRGEGENDIVQQMAALGWTLNATYPTSRDEWLGVFNPCI